MEPNTPDRITVADVAVVLMMLASVGTTAYLLLDLIGSL